MYIFEFNFIDETLNILNEFIRILINNKNKWRFEYRTEEETQSNKNNLRKKCMQPREESSPEDHQIAQKRVREVTFLIK